MEDVRDLSADIVLTPDELRSLGTVVALATVLEKEVALGIWSFLNIAGLAGFSVTAGLRFSNRMQMLRTLGETYISDPHEYESFLAAADVAETAYGRRNRAVHDEWTPALANDAFAARVTARGTIKTYSSLTALKASELERLAEELEGAIQGLRAFFCRSKIIDRSILKDNGYVLRSLPADPGDGNQ